MILSGKEVLEQLHATFPGTKIRATFPFLRVRIVTPLFAGLQDDEREACVADGLKLDIAQLRQTTERLFLRLELLADENEDPVPLPPRGQTWLGTFSDEQLELNAPLGETRVIHFYGFKGGQGRSTLLAFLATELARDGKSVLVVDLDAEAPSLDLVFGVGDVPLEASIVGLRAGVDLVPVTIDAPRGGGLVSLLGFRPSTEEFDLDAIALAFEASVHAPSHEGLAATLRDSILPRYDIVFFDHRTGLGPTVPAWVRTIPGPVVVMERLDGQSRRAVRAVERVWRGLTTPGAIVSYVSSNLSFDAMREQRRGEVWPWLEALAGAKSIRAEEALGAEDVEDHWILWPDDNAFRRGALPQRDEVGGLTRESIGHLRELLGLADRAVRTETVNVLHPSGAADQGLFIITDALRELSQPGSTVRFVFGRKGTGKTRLVRELVLRKVGDPLVVAEDEDIGGLGAQDGELRALLQRAKKEKDYEGLWWTLIAAALEGNDTSRERLTAYLTQTLPAFHTHLTARQHAQNPGRRVLLIDGLETMAPNRDEARDNIQALLNVSSALETDKLLRGRLSLRIFLRSDIARWGFENFEQQSHGKRLDLSWSTQTIFNFVLSRLPSLPWFRDTFPDVIKHIHAREGELQETALSEADCLDILLQVFPQKLSRLNLNTATFLRTYFSDDPSGLQSYYPRVYDKFLERIDAAKRPLVEGRVSQDVMMSAHDDASSDFLTQVRQELRYLVPLEERDLDRFIGALKEQRTPFVRKTLANTIRNSLKIKMEHIDATFEQMKEIGIFEQHPARPDQWRVGRLFKAALRMKYGTAKKGEKK